jgi:hypothetical protein
MLKVKKIGLWVALLGIALTTQGCWEDDEDQLTLLGDGGCRTADGGTGEPAYLSGMSLEECKAQCFNGKESCTAVEYNANNSMCEIHSDPITTYEKVESVACYVTR